MDRHALALLIPILALSIPVLAIAISGFQKLARIRLEETRLRLEGPDGSSRQELELLRGEVDELRRELSELHERVDFAERLLARPERQRIDVPGITPG
jgi:hypothetical protein